MTEYAKLAQLARHAAVVIPNRPLLVPWVAPIDTGGGLLELRASDTHYPLRHALIASAFRTVSDRLDGTHTVSEITADLPEDVAPATVVFLLKTLRAVGVLIDGAEFDGTSPASQAILVYLSRFDPSPAIIARRLATCSVTIIGGGALAAQVAADLRATECSGLTLRPDATELPASDLVVAASDSWAGGFTSINAAALARGIPWLRVALDGTRAWLGPLVVPGETACFACLSARQEANTGFAAAATPPGETFPPLVRLAAAHAALEVTRFIGRHQAPATFGYVYELSGRSPAAVRQAIPRNPGCRACGRLWGSFEPTLVDDPADH